MPYYDRLCRACGWQAIDVWEPVHADAPTCPQCAAQTERAWLTTPPTAIGDECDFTQTNGTPTPIRFRSKSEHRRWLKQHGYEVVASHVGQYGTDKSPFSTNWAATYDPYTAANAKILIERAFKSATIDAPPVEMHIRTDVHEMSREEARRYVR
jgi:hypothetical protein